MGVGGHTTPGLADGAAANATDSVKSRSGEGGGGVWQESPRGGDPRPAGTERTHRRSSFLFCLLFLLSHFGTRLFLTPSEETHERCLLKERKNNSVLASQLSCYIQRHARPTRPPPPQPRVHSRAPPTSKKKQNKRKKLSSAGRLAVSSSARKPVRETSQTETTVPRRQCSPPMLDCAPSRLFLIMDF